jgi:hypothetical protein
MSIAKNQKNIRKVSHSFMYLPLVKIQSLANTSYDHNISYYLGHFDIY